MAPRPVAPVPAEAAFRGRVCGRVQGVGFRWNAKEAARRLGLSGWVRNEEDGSVEVFAQGSRADLRDFELWLRDGPPGAFIESASLRTAAVDPDLRSFSIIH